MPNSYLLIFITRAKSTTQIIPILHKAKVKQRRVDCLPQGHTSVYWQIWE